VETWDAIRARRNVRAYTDRPIDGKDLDRILEAARLTPSSRNRQAWDFVVCTDRRQLEELSKVWRSAGHVASSAATIALVVPGSDDESIEYDLGQATMSIMLAAADLGIGSGHASVSDQDMARRILDLPDDRVCAYLVALGYPADGPIRTLTRHDRRPFGDVVHRDRW
jgi:nitroreductase